MALDAGVLDEFVYSLGGEKAAQVLEQTYTEMRDARRLRERLQAGRKEPLSSCIGQIRDRFGAVDEPVRQRLEELPPNALRVTARLLPGCFTRRELWGTLDLVANTVSDGILLGARRRLRKSIEERFGALDESLLYALELADASTVNACHARLETAETVRSALAPALESANR